MSFSPNIGLEDTFGDYHYEEEPLTPLGTELEQLVVAECPQVELELNAVAELAEKPSEELDETHLTGKQKRKFRDLQTRFGLADRADDTADPPLRKRKKETQILSESLESAEISPFHTVQPSLKVPRSLWQSLYPFQQEGVSFFYRQFSKFQGALLADDMGLGKTIQTLAFIGSAFLSNLFATKNVLIICPATLQSHWKSEIQKMAEHFEHYEFFTIIYDKGIDLLALSQESLNMVVTSYEQFRSSSTSFNSVRWSVVVADEAQRIRNPDTDTTTKLKSIVSDFRIALSGSPIQNNLRELWSVIDFIAPGRLGALGIFEENLAVPIEEGCRAGASTRQVQAAYRCALLLRQATAPLMLRRLKTEVAKWLHLPGREEQVLFCHLSGIQWMMYKEYCDGRSDKRKRWFDRASAFVALAFLRKLANHSDLVVPADSPDYGAPERSGKLLLLLSLLRRWKAEGRRALVFSQGVKMLDLIQKAVQAEGWSHGRIDGGTDLKTREIWITKFAKADSERDPFLLLLTTRVGGVGINLLGASRVVIFDPDWNPMTDAQARERSWRIGQTRDVAIYRLVAAGTVEEIVYKRQIYKHYLAQKILTDPRQIQTDFWSNLSEDLYRVPPKPPGVTDEQLLREESDRLIQKIRDPKATRDLRGGPDSDFSEMEDTPAQRAGQLVTAVWDQSTIEAPVISSVLYDERHVNRVAEKAMQSLGLGEVGRSTEQRPVSLLESLRQREPAKDSVELFPSERAIAGALEAFFTKQNRATTAELLGEFGEKISSAQQGFFKACLNRIAELKNGTWKKK